MMESPMASPRQVPLGARRKSFSGTATRLGAASAVARAASGFVHAQGLGHELDITPPRVRAQLRAFVEAGVMRQRGRVGSTVDYERVDGPFWEAVEVLAVAWSAE